MNPDKQKNFEQAFSTHSGGCRRQCNCGKEFYNPDGGWDFENGEIDRLEKAKATSLEWTVTTIQFEGKEYVVDCDCWHKRAEQIMGFIDSHNKNIAEYLKLEKQRALDAAHDMPEA